MKADVLIFLPTLKTGGAERQATLLACLLSERKTVAVVVFYGADSVHPSNAITLEQAGCKLVCCEGNLCSRLLMLWNIFLNSSNAVLFNYLTLPNVIGSIIARMAGLRKIYNGVRSTYLPLHKLIAECFAHNFFATGTVFNSYASAVSIGRYYCSRHGKHVIPNCFPNISTPLERANNAIKRIVTVGRFVKDKDYLTVIKTMAELRKNRVDFISVIIGYGEEESRIRAWINDYSLEGYVEMHINPPNVQELVCKSDIYFSASLFEGTSNAIMEALNWSLPVVATNVGDNNKLILDSVNGYLHEVGDYNAMALSIATLLDDVQLRRKMGIAGNHHLRENYSVDEFARRYRELI